jgi:hypothetical protein
MWLAPFAGKQDRLWRGLFAMLPFAKGRKRNNRIVYYSIQTERQTCMVHMHALESTQSQRPQGEMRTEGDSLMPDKPNIEDP